MPSFDQLEQAIQSKLTTDRDFATFCDPGKRRRVRAVRRDA